MLLLAALPPILTRCPAGVLDNSKQVGIFPRISLNYLLYHCRWTKKMLHPSWWCVVSKRKPLFSSFPPFLQLQSPWHLSAPPESFRGYKMCPQTNHRLYSHSLDDPQQAPWSESAFSSLSLWPSMTCPLCSVALARRSGVEWMENLFSVILCIAASCVLELYRVFNECDQELSTTHRQLSNSRCRIEKEQKITE